MNIFERASRGKTRFSTSKGELSTEDLWDLSLTSLDTIAKSVNKQLKTESEESFIEVKTSANTELELKLEILKHVITSKQAYAAAAKTKAEKQAKLNQLKELVAQKSNEALSQKSVEELSAMIAEMEA